MNLQVGVAQFGSCLFPHLAEFFPCPCDKLGFMQDLPTVPEAPNLPTLLLRQVSLSLSGWYWAESWDFGI